LAARYGHHRACDVWLYQAIYVEGDDRPRRSLAPGRFILFLEQWEPLRATL